MFHKVIEMSLAAINDTHSWTTLFHCALLIFHIHALHAISVLHFGVMLPLVVIINVVLSAFYRVSVCFDALWGGDHLFPGPLYVPVPLRWQYRLLHRVRVRAVRNSAHHSSRICHVSLLWLWVVKKWRNFHCFT